jgi:hypothetical protein
MNISSSSQCDEHYLLICEKHSNVTMLQTYLYCCNVTNTARHHNVMNIYYCHNMMNIASSSQCDEHSLICDEHIPLDEHSHIVCNVTIIVASYFDKHSNVAMLRIYPYHRNVTNIAPSLSQCDEHLLLSQCDEYILVITM